MMYVTALDIARRHLGLRELPGAENSHAVQWWHELAGLGVNTADEVPWCASFVHYVAWALDLPRPKIPARARSWLRAGVPVAPEDAAPGGDVVILMRGGGPQPGADVIAAPGHVGFFAGRDTDGNVLVLGGNQSNKVSVQSFPLSRVLGIRRLHT